ncbi:related to Pyruvate dehydrogenase complex protein X component, mitochondrial [Zygosaccharomyces bailii]|nr:related to Pyruvate dehydrogenase complex protein X component, mitochondrial [Zygosaccharomyces bailii]
MLRSAFLRSSRSIASGQLRGLHVSRRLLDAHPYKMPAVSPTMDKGNLVEWKYEIGDEINAGDVLLEVESDKAQVEVESQEDVVLAKILVGNGTKDIPVGQVIAWLADVGDDLSSLKIPDVKEEPKIPKKEEKAEVNPKEEPTKTSDKSTGHEKGQKKPAASNDSNGVLNPANPTQTLLPSVHSLLSENKISREDAIKNIKASGKNGRLLKGDVLAYLGKISENSVVKVAEFIKRGEKLDLSNIELRENASSGEQLKPTKAEAIVIEDKQVVQLPVGVTLNEYRESLRAFVDTAFHRAHGQPLANAQSQYYDDIFESLITPAPGKPRFTVSYELEPLVGKTQAIRKGDILDILSGAITSKAETLNPAAFERCLFTYKVCVNEDLPDAEVKAKKFVTSLKELETC